MAMCIREMIGTIRKSSYRRRRAVSALRRDEGGFLLLDVIGACAVTLIMMTTALHVGAEANHLYKKAQILRHIKRIGQDVVENRKILLPSQNEWVHTYEKDNERYTVRLIKSTKEGYTCYDVEIQAPDGATWFATKWEEKE